MVQGMRWWLMVLLLAGGAHGFASEKAVVERGIRFLEREVFSWRGENGCFSCHNNGDGARALLLARKSGFVVDENALKETGEFLKRPDEWGKNKGDPGFSDKRLPLIQFAAALTAADANWPELGKATELIGLEQSEAGFWK